MPEVHAILSASSSKRWLNCTPSARLEQNFPNESSVYAEEGTAAHALGEYKLRKYLHERVKRPTSEFDNEEMDANTDIYAEFIISTVERIKETCAHPLVMVEERLDYSYLVPQGFGTGDCVIIADDTLYVMDYKNGKGVFVSCDHNPQMMLYALGAYHAYGYLYSITKVSMTIIQPRLENISTFECSVEELLNWAESYVRPRAKLAFEGKGEQVPGDWCRFCRARTSCKACAAEAMALVILFQRTKAEMDAYHDMSRKPESWTVEDIAHQRIRFCSIWQVIEEAELVDEYEAWKEANPNA